VTEEGIVIKSLEEFNYIKTNYRLYSPWIKDLNLKPKEPIPTLLVDYLELYIGHYSYEEIVGEIHYYSEGVHTVLATAPCRDYKKIHASFVSSSNTDVNLYRGELRVEIYNSEKVCNFFFSLNQNSKSLRIDLDA
jgi:hypothetical protein